MSASFDGGKIKVEPEEEFEEWMKDSVNLDTVTVNNPTKEEKEIKPEEIDGYSTFSDSDDVFEDSSGSNYLDEDSVDGCSSGQLQKDSTISELKKKQKQSRKKKVVNVKKEALQRLCEDSSTTITNLVGSQCQYLCFVCHRTFRSWCSLKHHLRTNLTHGPPISIEEHLKFAACHECEICKEKILADRGFLFEHMKVKHNIGLDDYCVKFGKKHSGRYMHKKDAVKKILSTATISTDIIGNLCLYRCPRCNIVFNSWSILCSHLGKMSHGPKGQENMSMYITKSIGHKCKLCSKLLLCDSTYLLTHLRKHKIYDLRIYCKKTKSRLPYVDRKTSLQKLSESSCRVTRNVGNLCIFSCKECHKEWNTWINLKCHLKKCPHYAVRYEENDKPTIWNDLGQFVTKCIFHLCNICEEKMLCDPFFIREHAKTRHSITASEYLKKVGLSRETITTEQFDSILKGIPTYPSQPYVETLHPVPDEHSTNRLGDLCKFACNTCPNPCNTTWINLVKQHLWPTHHSRKYRPEICPEARYHKCRLCQVTVLADRFFINQHLKKIHKEINLSKYTQMVREAGHLVLYSGPGTGIRCTVKQTHVEHIEHNYSAPLPEK